MNAHSIYAALGGRKSGNGYKVHCPAHNDEHPSLSVTDKDGTTLVHCHAGCDSESVIGELRERGLWWAEIDCREDLDEVRNALASRKPGHRVASAPPRYAE